MKNIKLKALFTALFLVVAFAAFASSQAEKADELTGTVNIAGSSTVFPISTAVAEEFSKVNPNVVVPVQSTGTGGGFANFFLPGKTDINDASRSIKASEIETARANGFEALEFVVATDAITIVINPAATWVDDITVEQLAKIWRPENPAMMWSDVDSSWPEAKFELYGPTAASGTFEYFTDEIIGEAYASRDDFQKTEQDNTIVAAVAGSQYAMGYFGLSYYLENQDKVKALRVNGIAPSLETAKTYEYSPLSRPLYIYVSSKSLERPEVVAYVRYYLDQIDTDLIKEIGYVPMTKADADVQRANFEAAVEKYGM